MRKTIRTLAIALMTSTLFVPLAKGQQDLDIDGDWTLESVTCDDGTLGEKRYDSVLLTVSGDLISAVLIKDGCEISLEGVAQMNDHVLSAEFSSGSWTACSGNMPTYVLNRFDAAREGAVLRLSGTDLTPFGSCKGRSGTLTFKGE